MHKIPTFSTAIGIHVSGIESRAYRQAFPLWEFQLTYEVLREQTQNETAYAYYSGFTELETISQLFLSCLGSYGEFFYDDPDDDSRSAQSQIYDTDGTTTVWQVYRSWGSTLVSYEPISGINLNETVNVYLDGVLQNSDTYSVANTLNGVFLTFDSAPAAGKAVTMDFSYYYRCHFIEDMHDYNEFYKNLWELRSCKFRSLKP